MRRPPGATLLWTDPRTSRRVNGRTRPANTPQHLMQTDYPNPPSRRASVIFPHREHQAAGARASAGGVSAPQPEQRQMSRDCFSGSDTIHILLPTNDCLVDAHVPTARSTSCRYIRSTRTCQ